MTTSTTEERKAFQAFYESGRVELDVRGTAAVMHDYLRGAQAILIGFELYEANFPEELKVES